MENWKGKTGLLQENFPQSEGGITGKFLYGKLVNEKKRVRKGRKRWGEIQGVGIALKEPRGRVKEREFREKLKSLILKHVLHTEMSR